MVTTPEGNTLLGEVVDLSPLGAGLLLPVAPAKLPKGTNVSLLIEAHELPDPDGEGGIISLRATVMSAQAHSSAGPSRVGVRFLVEALDLTTRLAPLMVGRLAGGTGAGEAIAGGLVDAEPIGPHLAATAAGRERLYQRALAELRGREPNPARALELVRWALAQDPQNVAYRACEQAASGFLALGAGDEAGASRALDAARALAPDAPEVLALAAKVPVAMHAMPVKKSFLARLLGR
jgi:hypothetical protein